MTLLIEQIHHDRIRFLQKNYEPPNRVLVLRMMRYRLLGELLDHYQITHADRITIMGMKVVFSEDVSRIEVALVLN